MDQCPCGSEKAYANCCQPLISGEENAETAEALMRSRYSAHARKAFDYLFDTTYPGNRQAEDHDGTAAWSKKLEWQRLQVRSRLYLRLRLVFQRLQVQAALPFTCSTTKEYLRLFAFICGLLK